MRVRSVDESQTKRVKSSGLTCLSEWRRRQMLLQTWRTVTELLTGMVVQDSSVKKMRRKDCCCVHKQTDNSQQTIERHPHIQCWGWLRAKLITITPTSCAILSHARLCLEPLFNGFNHQIPRVYCRQRCACAEL